jgi:hypothetical protein
VYDKEVPNEDGHGTHRIAATRPGKLSAFKYELVDVANDRPIFNLVDRNPATPNVKEPIWSEPDVGQRVLMLSGEYAYVLYEENEDYLSEAEKAKLRSQGRIATKADELRTVSRQLRVLDVNTGRLARPEWNMNLMDFAHVKGSMQERDRAIYLATNDGYLFKLYATKSKSAAGGK